MALAPFVQSFGVGYRQSGGGPGRPYVGGGASSSPGSFTPTADFVANWTGVQQTMAGFGASDRNSGTLTSGQLDLFYNVSGGIGLSLHRASIDTDGGYSQGSDPANAVGAYSRGAKVWAAPWSPPAVWKDNGSTTGGGHLFSANYGDWADLIVGFINAMSSTYSVPIYGISPQNEPDFTASWDSCIYDNAQIIAFIKVLGPKLAALTPRPILIAPEAANWGGLWSYADAILADGVAAPFLDVIATHDYTYSTSTGNPQGRPVWQTEVSLFAGSDDPSISDALGVASWINRALTTGGCSAWHWWEHIDPDGNNQGLVLSGGGMTKRLFTLGNWSKFVRPGWVRLSVTGTVSGVSVTAFKHPTSGAFAIVAVNATGSPKSASFGLAGPGCSSVAPWVTSGTTIGAIGSDGNLSLGSSAASLSTSLPLTGNALTLALPVGVTTLVGST